MSLHLPRHSSPQAVQTTFPQSPAQTSGHPLAAPQPSALGINPLPASVQEANVTDNHQLTMPSDSAPGHASSSRNHDWSGMAEIDDLDAETFGAPGACLAGGKGAGSDTDMTQEDLPALPLPSTSQEECPSSQEQQVELGRSGDGKYHSTGVHHDEQREQASCQPSTRQQQAQHERPPLLKHLQQQQQHARLNLQQHQHVALVQEKKHDLRWEEEAGAAPVSSESQVIDLDDEAADDLLDVLADAAAQAPAPARGVELAGHKHRCCGQARFL